MQVTTYRVSRRGASGPANVAYHSPMARAHDRPGAAANPLAAALDRVGDRWSPQLVAALLGGPLRYGELRGAVGGIAPTTLPRAGRRSRPAGIARPAVASPATTRWTRPAASRRSPAGRCRRSSRFGVLPAGELEPGRVGADVECGDGATMEMQQARPLELACETAWCGPRERALHEDAALVDVERRRSKEDRRRAGRGLDRPAGHGLGDGDGRPPGGRAARPPP